MAQLPPGFKPHLAHVVDNDGNTHQVLNEAGDDWDEEATARAAAVGTLPEPEVAVARRKARR